MKRQFKIIPVLDLKDGLVVRGIRGDRAKYQPVQSKLTPSAEFSDVLEAFHTGFGFEEFYIADLDALTSGGERNQLSLLANRIKTNKPPVSFMVDAGIRDAAGIAGVVKAGVKKIVVGTETLLSLEALKEMVAVYDSRSLVVSIDIRGTEVISSSPEIARMTPAGAVREIRKTGIQDFILLQLGKVGTGEGLDKPLIQECLSVLAEMDRSDVTLLVGGGISGSEDLKWLADLGLDGALIASVLHDGKLGPDTVRALQDYTIYKSKQKTNEANESGLED
ncbi:MAG: hypothetical protein GX434_16900 [Peptococcaceae bacterium]|nr:hypothetical protein [Peptococcaceae bacterium]